MTLRMQPSFDFENLRKYVSESRTILHLLVWALLLAEQLIVRALRLASATEIIDATNQTTSQHPRVHKPGNRLPC
jgi:hypothetical protein